MAHKQSRMGMMIGTGVLVVGVLVYAFWPRAVMVDMGVVTRGAMIMTIDEEAKTRVRDAYVVSAPIAGRVLRVEVEPGDSVVGGETVIARMLPLNPSALDVRTREQARATVSAAQAGLRVSRADLNKALADKDLADLDVGRARELRRKGTIAQIALDRAERVWRSAQATFDTARAAISMREAELANARAHLISFSERRVPGSAPLPAETAIPLKAPVSGRILRVMQESATTLAAGTPILEIGDISNDLEIVVELLSTDAVQVHEGDRVIIEKWGQPHALSGVIERVEPWGFTKFSALGVEEQRVNTLVRFIDPLEQRNSLGHGFRVETRIVIWEAEDVVLAPSSALFREKGNWGVFVVEGGHAQFRPVTVGHNNGVKAEVMTGVRVGEQLILYPGPGILDGTMVSERMIE